MSAALYYVGIGLATAVAVEGAYLALARDSSRARRVRARLDALRENPAYTREEREIIKRRLLSDLPGVHRFLVQLPGTDRLARELEGAGLATKAAAILGWSAALLGVVFLVPALAGVPVLIAVVLAIIAGALPFAYVALKRHQRVSRFSSQLPEAIDLLVRALKAGHSLPSGFRLIGDELADPIAREFAHVHEELNLGRSLDQALENLIDRIDTQEVRLLSTSILIQRETGGNLVEILESLAGTVRRSMVFRDKLSALTAEGRLSGLVLISLPPAMVLIISVLNPAYARMLFVPGVLRLALVGAALAQLAGMLWIRRIVSVRY